MPQEDTSLQGECVDTSLPGHGGEGGQGIDGVRPIFPDDSVSELPFWDSIAQEAARLSGARFRLWSVRRAKNRHPLYGEPSQDGDWDFHGPWEMLGGFEFDQGQEIDPEAGSEGLQKTANAVLYIARKELEDRDSPVPKIGDVVDLWDREPFGSEFQFWDVTKANPDGNIWSTEVYVQYRLELKRRSRFEPGRKTMGRQI